LDTPVFQLIDVLFLLSWYPSEMQRVQLFSVCLTAESLVSDVVNE